MKAAALRGTVTRARAETDRLKRHPARGTVNRGHGIRSKEHKHPLEADGPPPLTVPRRRFARGITVPVAPRGTGPLAGLDPLS
jgi:hypothetical protein